MNLKKLKTKLKDPIVAIPLALTVLGAIWYGGLGIKHGRITECRGVSTAYVNADFSEYWTAINMEGELESGTEYWSELASEVHEVHSINGEISGYSHEEAIKPDSLYAAVPEHLASMASMSDFDRFSIMKSSYLEVAFSNSSVGDYFTKELSYMDTCTERLGTFIKVKVWYGISYNSEF